MQPDLWVESEDLDRNVGMVPMQRAHEHLSLALASLPADHHAIIFEDDDWYGQKHIESLVNALDHGFQLAMCDPLRFYHVPLRRFFTDKKQKHAVEAATGIHRDWVRWYAEGIRKDGWALEAWNECKNRVTTIPTFVGIKGAGNGLPGRAGASSKHTADKVKRRWGDDHAGRKLRSWIGSDADVYFAMCKR